MSSNLASVFLPVILSVLILQLIMVVIGLIGTVFWIWMLIDCLLRKFKSNTNKIIWVLVIVFGHFIGALIYFIFVKRGK